MFEKGDAVKKGQRTLRTIRS